MANEPTKNEKAVLDRLDALDKAAAEFDKRIVAVGERLAKLENVKLPDAVDLTDINSRLDDLETAHGNSRDIGDLRPLIDEVNKLHLQLFGVPAGTMPSLVDNQD